MGVVTISATYGAGGNEVGHAVAAALDLTFVDRAIPAAVARELDVAIEDAEAKDETAATGLWRLISSMAMVPDLSGAGPLVYGPVPDERAFREKTEQVLQEIAAGPGGVILGRAAALVLAGVPDALHVRLDGPPEARVRRAIAAGLDEEEAWRRLRENDAARTGYVRHFYRCDPADCAHYHLVIDSTAVGLTAVTAMIVTAARARLP